MPTDVGMDKIKFLTFWRKETEFRASSKVKVEWYHRKTNMYVLNVWKLTTGLRDSFIYANVPDFPNLYGCVHGRTPKAPPKIPSKHLTLKK